MPGEPLALSTVPPPATADTDYDAICAAVAATARGRWFLDEYAKRNRHSDTSQVLNAIARMEAAVMSDRAQQASRQAHQEVRVELLEMARTIAQTRAEVAESRPDPQHADAATTGESAPDAAAAAERLRQIAWTMRACGIDLPASDQIGQIADTILSADALRNLGDQRAHKLTEALHYLEHRIDRMLDSHLAAAAALAADDGAEPAADDPVSTANGANDNDHHADATVLTLAAPLAGVATTLETEAGIAPTRSAEGDSAAAAFIAAANAAEFPMDDDVVLTVADGAVEPSRESVPLSEVAWSPAPPPEAAASDIVMREPESVAAREPDQDPGQVPADEPGSAFASAADVVAGESVAAWPQVSAEEPDAIAMQVEQDLDQLADAAPVVSTFDATPVRQQEPSSDVATARADEPADFLLEAPAATPADHAPMAALVASAQATRAQLSSALAAIETELSAAATPLSVRTDAAMVMRPASADGPLAALMLLSEEERLALFS